MNNQLKLFDLAKQARLNAYAPYSKFSVGAAIVTDKGNFYSGCNVENASYPCGTCAESGAIAAMVCNGETNIAEILVIADTDCILPCGNCLQKIAEFASMDTLVHSADLQKIVQTKKMSEIFPQRFSIKVL